MAKTAEPEPVRLDRQGQPIVQLENVHKTYRDTEALRGIRLDVATNEFVTIVGPSGCGKSTLLRIVAGLIPPTGGTVQVGGKPVTGPVPGIGFVFQSPALLPWRTALQNVLLVAELGGLDPRRYRSRAMELLDLVGLAGREGAYPHELSGGMRQRVALCRALLLSPPLILMDEPFGALDVITREQMAIELERIWESTKTTILFVTHSVTEAVLLADRVVVMSRQPGRIKETVPVALPRPRDASVFDDRSFQDLCATLRRQLGEEPLG